MNHPICSLLSLTALLVAASGPAVAQDERTMALVTIAEANAECLTRTRSDARRQTDATSQPLRTTSPAGAEAKALRQ